MAIQDDKKRKASPKADHKSKKYDNNNHKKPKKQSEPSSEAHRHQRRHAESVEHAKRIWNQLRVKSNTPEQNRDHVNQLLPLIKGKAHQVALQHDASRCVQACVQFGTPKERNEILKELMVPEAGLVELSKNQYACFTVLKLIKYCHADDECATLILKSFKGHVAKLAVHAVASRVIASIFTSFSSKQTAFLKQEFYGPHFALFAGDDTDKTPPTLVANLAKMPAKKEQTLEFLRNIINKGMAKTLYGLDFFQGLCAEYVAVADTNEVRQMATTAADHAIHLLSSRAGTRVVAMLVAYGTAKDRKRIMKSLKGYARSGLLHPDAYLAIVRLVQLTDDTVSIQKNVLNELTVTPETNNATNTKEQKEEKDQDHPLLELALNDNASKLLLMILMPPGAARTKLFDPYENSVLFPNPTVREDGQEVPTSRKDPEQRRKELLDCLKEPLMELCCKHASELVFSLPGSAVLREVYAAFRPESVVNAVVNVCEGALNGNEENGSPTSKYPLFEDKVAHYAIKNMLKVDDISEDSPLATTFLERLGERLMDIAQSNRGAFVVAELCNVPVVKTQAKSKIAAHLKEIKTLSKAEGSTAGYEALLKAISS